jgi:serine/threonine protein kinase
VEALEKPVAGAEIDGYRLIRRIGQGGFGSVWLCWSEATRGYHALKWVTGDASGLKLELDALRKFREVSQKLRSPNLIAIGHINLLPCGLIYTLPLTDGMEGNDPAVESWRPMTLAHRIDGKNRFTSAEIRQIILPIIRATAALNDEGLVHRDIKPANILFFGGVPCLSDIGLLANDSASLTQRGTPGFLPPSWYLESSGQPDMWGLATTLYTLLTGNNPD